MVDVPVNDQTPSIVVTVVSDGQVNFNYDFRVDAAGDLLAEYRHSDGTTTDLVGGVDFTVDGLGTAAGGSITLVTFTATVTGETMAIFRSISIQRQNDYSRDLFAEDLNAEQDKLFMIAQELRRDVDRSVKADFGDNPDELVDDIFEAQAAAQASAAAAATSETNAGVSASAADGSADAAAASAAAAAATVNAKFIANPYNVDASPNENYNPGANGFAFQSHTTGSSNFPGLFGEVVCFNFGGAGRAWDIWKGNGGQENWHLRSSNIDGVTFGPWRRIIHDGLKASDGNADAGTDDTNYMTSAKVVRWFDNWVTKLWGAASLGRSQRARWSDTVNLRDWFDRTGGAGTEGANNAALTALIAYLVANPSVRTLKGNMGDVYRIGGNINFTFPAGVRLMMDGAEFDANVGLGAGASTLFTFGSKCHVEGLAVHVLTGSTFRRLIDFEDQNVVRDLLVYADTQIANSGASPLLDYAVRYRGQRQNVRGAKIVNIDRAHFAYGDGGDGVPSQDFRLIDLVSESYVTGLNLRNLIGAVNRGFRCKTRAANATDDPGHNGIVHEGVAEYLLSDFVVKDSAEHGIRFGATRNAEQASRVITVGDGSIWRSGQSGFKMFTGVAGAFFRHVNVSNVNVVDCQYEPGTPGELPGFNDEGFLLQQVKEGVFQGLRVSKQDSFTGFSCMDGVYLSGADNVVISGLQVMDAKRNAVRISEWDGDTTANPETLSNNEIMIRGLQGENIGEDGICIDHITQSLRDINIEGEVIGTNAATFYGVRMTGAVARFVQPSLVQLKSRNFSGGLTNLASSGNWKVRDVFGATY